MDSCPRLPSADHASMALQGDPASIAKVGLDIVMRAGLIGIGMLLIGQRENVVKNALAGSAAIEVFVLLWIGAQKIGSQDAGVGP